MEVCLMRKWRDIWLVGLLSKMLQNNGQDIHMCDNVFHWHMPFYPQTPLYTQNTWIGMVHLDTPAAFKTILEVGT